jgi:hypothetical protein
MFTPKVKQLMHGRCGMYDLTAANMQAAETDCLYTTTYRKPHQ